MMFTAALWLSQHRHVIKINFAFKRSKTNKKILAETAFDKLSKFRQIDLFYYLKLDLFSRRSRHLIILQESFFR